MATNFPASYDDSGSMPPKIDGDVIFAAEDNTQIGAIQALEQKIGKTGTEPFVNIKLPPYNAPGDGSDVTSILQTAHNDLSDGSTIVLPKGSYLIGQLNWTKKINILGMGTPEEVVLTAKAGATGPLLNVNFASLKHHLRFENFYIDMTNATGIVALYLNNLDLATIANVKVREGSVAFDIDSVAATDFNQCWAFNQRTSGFRVKNAAAIDNTYNRCFVYMTSGAAANMSVAGFDIQNGASHYLNGVRILRSTASSFFMPYGIKVDSPSTTDWLFLNNVVVDAITDGTGANSATSAGMYLLNCAGVFSSNSFYSANTSSGQKQRGVLIDGGSRFVFNGGRISGSGLGFANSVDVISLQGVDFPANFADAALNFGSATVTNLQYNLPPPGGAIANDNVKLSAATASVKGYMGNGKRIIVSDASSAEALILEHASTGKTKRIRVNNGSTGTLEILGDNGTTKLLQVTDSQQIIVGGGSNTIQSGTGSPEGVKTATVGSIFIRTDGGTSTVFYIKETGSGNTGWVALGGTGSYQLLSEKGAASGYASLDSTTKVPSAQLGSGTPDSTTVLFGDQTWKVPVSGAILATIVDAKGDLIVGTGADTVARLAVGADDTIPMADAAQTTGIKWVGPATASNQAFGDTAIPGTDDTFTRGGHKHGMPTSTAGPDADIAIDVAGAAGTANTAARSAHGHKLATYTPVALPLGQASAGTATDAPSRGTHVHPDPTVYDYTISFDGTNYTAKPNKSYSTTYINSDLATVFNSLTSYIGPAAAGPFKGPAGGTTTLSVAISNTNDNISVTVADGTFGGTNPLNTSDKVLIQIENEYMNIDSIAGNVLHVTSQSNGSRGTMGSTAATHPINAVVTWYDLTKWGGSVYLIQPPKSAGPMIVNTPLKGINGCSLLAEGGEVILKAGNSFPVNSCMVDFAYTDRITIDGLVVDCNNKAQVGIRHRRNQNFESASNIGGPASANFIENCRVYNYTATTSGHGAAFMIGVKDENTATANLSFSRNTARGAGSASVSNFLAADIDNVTQTITVTNGSTFPSTSTTTSAFAGHFMIQIDSEFIWVQDTPSANTYTVKRGVCQTAPVSHTSGGGTKVVTAYFGSAGLRSFIGDFQMNYCNFNNTAAVYSAGVYADAHIVIYQTHIAASANNSIGNVYLVSADHSAIAENYLDTIQSGAGIYVGPPTGSCNNLIIRNNYFNMQTIGNDNTRGYGIILDATNANIYNALIANNEFRGPTANFSTRATAMPKAAINSIGTEVTGMLMANNTAPYFNKLWDGTKPYHLGPNIVYDGNSGGTRWKIGGGETLVKAGAPSGTEGVDFLHLYAGIDCLNTTNSHVYVYNGTTWIDTGGTPTQLLATFSKQGALSTSSGALRMYINGSWTITKVRASVGTPPTTQSIQLDINKLNANANLPGDNTSSIWPSDQNNRVAIGAGNHTGVSTTFTTTPTLVDNDFLTLDIDQVGSGTVGSDLVVEVWGQ